MQLQPGQRQTLLLVLPEQHPQAEEPSRPALPSQVQAQRPVQVPQQVRRPLPGRLLPFCRKRSAAQRPTLQR